MSNKMAMILFLLIALIVSGSIWSENIAAQESTVADTDANRRKTVTFDAVDGTVADPENWNPIAPGRRMDHGFHQAVIEPLFILNYESGEFINWLGESMTANETLDVWTLKLREGITWSDGEAFNADDVVFTVNLMLEHAPKLEASASMKTWVKEIEKVDDLTVRFTLHKPNARFQLDVWSVKVWGGITVVPEHIWKDQDPLTFKNYAPEKGWPVFTGPYKLVSASESRVEYVRDDNWWGARTGWKPLPKPEKLVWGVYASNVEGVEAVATNDLDSLDSISLKALLDLKQRNPNIVTYVDNLPYAWVPDPCSRTFDFNLMVEQPWKDKDLRWAVNYAINRNNIISFALDDTTLPSRHFFPVYSALNRYVDLLEETGLYEQYPILEHNPEKAKALIESKGYTLNSEGFYEKDGQELTLDFTVVNSKEFREIGSVIADQLQQVGIKATVTVYKPYSEWYQKSLVGDFSAQMGWWTCGSVNEPWASMDTFNTRWLTPIAEQTGENQNIWRWSGEAADKYSALVDEIGSLPLRDPKIDTLFVEAMTYWLDELPVIPITQAMRIIPFNTTYWTGWPSMKNNYIHPPTWWQSTHVIIHNLEPAQP